jgi:hypothetical protein
VEEDWVITAEDPHRFVKITRAVSSVEGDMSENGREEQERAYPNEPVKKRAWE